MPAASFLSQCLIIQAEAPAAVVHGVALHDNRLAAHLPSLGKAMHNEFPEDMLPLYSVLPDCIFYLLIDMNQLGASSSCLLN